MKKQICCALVIAATLVLTGCGVKGSLYVPTASTQTNAR